MGKMIRRWWIIPASLVLLFPARLFAVFFSQIVEAATGLGFLGYILGCLIFGACAALPILVRIGGSGKSGSVKLLGILAVAVLFGGLLFLSAVSVG